MSVLGVIGIILLTLLKIVLILLLVILILLLLVLILPIDYEATGRADGSKGFSGVEVRAKLRVFLGLLRFHGMFRGGDVSYSLKLAGFSLKKGGRKAPEKTEPTDEDFPEARKETEPAAQERKAEPETVAPGEGQAKEAKASQVQETPEIKKDIPREKAEKKPAKPPGPGLAERMDQLREKAEDGYYAVADGLNAASDRRYEAEEKLSGALERARNGWDWLNEPVNIRTLKRVKKAVGRILRHVLPNVLKIKGIIGTGDPAMTGKILGAFYSFYPLYADRWELELAGEFLEKKIQGRFYMKGRIRLIVIVGSALGLLADRNIRRWIWKRIRKKKPQA